VAIERTERVEPDAPETKLTTVVLDRKQPDYLGSFDPADLPPKGDDDENLINAHTGFGAVLRDWNERCNLIDINPNLSAVGKTDAKAKALPEFEARFKPLDEVLASHEAKAETAEKEISGAQLFKAPDAVAAIRDGEVRGWFAKLPRGGKGGQVEIMQAALADNDEELLRAVLGAPRAMKLISDELRTHLIAAVAGVRYPDKIAAVDRQRRRVDVVKFASKRAREVLHNTFPQSMRERITGVK
jgi:hypothetical protein